MKFICCQLTHLNDLFNKSIYKFVGEYKIEYNLAKKIKLNCLKIFEYYKRKKICQFLKN